MSLPWVVFPRVSHMWGFLGRWVLQEVFSRETCKKAREATGGGKDGG